MSYILIIIVILMLYLRTYKYNWNIDDHVPRSGMYVTVPPPRVPVDEYNVRFDDKQRSFMATFTNIGTYILVCCLINYIWGWKVSLLYAVMPTNVSGVAWGRTGNYYMTTCFLVLTAYFFLSSFSWGIVPAMLFFYAGLESTISALPLFVVALTFPYGWLLAIPLAKFLTSGRFVNGIKKRKKLHEDVGMKSAEVRPKNIILVIEVMAYYVLLATGFMPLGFFHTLGRRGELFRLNLHFFLSLALVVTVCYFGYTYDVFGLFWWLMFMGLFCQAVPNLGQFVTERYMYIANIGMSIMLCSFFEQLPELYWVLVGMWFMVSYRYIPAWRSNIALFSHGIASFPRCPDHYVNLSSYYMEKGMFLEAVKPLHNAIRFTFGEKYKLWGNLAKCYLAYKEKKKAIWALQNALQDASPDQIQTIKNLMKEIKRDI